MAIYRFLMSIEVSASHDGEAHEQALRLEKMLKTPLLKMAVEGEGVRLVGDGRPIVYQPQRQ